MVVYLLNLIYVRFFCFLPENSLLESIKNTRISL